MNQLKECGLKAISKAALGIALGSVSKASCLFLHQPSVSQNLKKQLEEKKNNK